MLLCIKRKFSIRCYLKVDSDTVMKKLEEFDAFVYSSVYNTELSGASNKIVTSFFIEGEINEDSWNEMVEFLKTETKGVVSLRY